MTAAAIPDMRSLNFLRTFTPPIVTIVLIAATISSCATVKRIAEGEPAALSDATPPPSYQQHFISSLRELPQEPAAMTETTTLEISRIDARDPNRVRLYAHLIDANGGYLSGATLGKWKSKWCLVADSSNGKRTVIQKYTVKEATERVRVPSAVALVMDHSGSMGESRAVAIQEAALRLIDRKRDEDALSLIKYDSKVSVVALARTDPSELRPTLPITGLQGFGGGTAIANGVAAGLDELRALPKRYENRAVVIFTDGVDNSSTVNRDSLVRLARKENVTFCAIGFGNGIDEKYLLQLAEPSGGIYKKIYSTGEIDDVIEDVYRRLRNYYVFEYAPPSYGLHAVKLSLCTPGESYTANGVYDNTPDIGDLSMIDVNFELNKAEITEASASAIDNVVILMNEYPLLTIEVRGHTDNSNATGDPEHNNKLSERRAEAVRNALVKRGIKKDRIKSKGYGDTMPVADNSTEEGRARNRRTEFLILSK